MGAGCDGIGRGLLLAEDTMDDVDEIQRRSLIAACRRAIAQAERAERGAREIAEDLRYALDGGAGDAGVGETRAMPVHDSAMRAFRDLQARFENPHFSENDLATGLAPIDEAFGGLARGALHVVCGPGESGRTALALAIASEVARRGVPTLFVSHREPPQALTYRLMFGEAGFADDRSIGGERWDALVQSTLEISESALTLGGVDRAANTPLRRVLEALDVRRGADAPAPTLLIVDDADEAPEGTFAALRTLKRWARRHGSAVIAVTRRTESLHTHGPLEPDAVVRLARPEPGVIVMRGTQGGGNGELRAPLVFSAGRGWIDVGASNAAFEEAEAARREGRGMGRE